MFQGEVTAPLHGVKFLISTNAPRYAVTAHSVNATAILGRQAVGCVELDGSVKMIVKNPGPSASGCQAIGASARSRAYAAHGWPWENVPAEVSAYAVPASTGPRNRATPSDTDDSALAVRLSDAMVSDDLVSAPILPLDVSAAAAANEASLYTQWLRDGEDALAALTTGQVAALTTAQLNALTSTQAAKLTTDGIVALTTDQISALSTAAVAALGTDQVQAIETADLQKMTTAEKTKSKSASRLL